MKPTLELLRREPRARRVLAAYAQSALGNGAGYVALVVIAYDRWRSPWSIAIVLVADFVPAMLLGPLFGAAADRWSRRRIAIASDLMRAIAFAGIALVGGIVPTVAFALLAGVGAGLFTPAILAGLPSLVDHERRVAATTSLYSGLTDVGNLVGPGFAALLIALTSTTVVVAADAATFVVSAAVLLTVRFGAVRRPAGSEAAEAGLLRQARDGLAAVARMPGVRTLVLATGGVLMFSAMLNVTELLLAKSLGAGTAGYALLVVACGVGVIAGSFSAAGDAEEPVLKRRYLLGLLLIGAGLVVAVVPSLPVAALGLTMTGLGNGVVIANQRLICQKVVPDGLLARTFGAFDTVISWAFAIAFVGAGAGLSATTPQVVLLVAGLGSIGIWAWSHLALRGLWEARPGASEDERPEHVAPQTPAARALARPAHVPAVDA